MAEILTPVQGMNVEGFTPWAHQFGPDEDLPGNVMATARRAWELGFRHLETDVRLTRGGVLVLAHDPRLEEDGIYIADMLPPDLKAAQRNGYGLITLDNLLEEFPEAIISVDSKWDERPGRGPICDDGARLCIKAIRKRKALNRVCISSFNGDRIRYMRSLAPPGTVSTLGDDELLKLAIDLAGPTSEPKTYSGQIVSVSTHVKLPDGVHKVVTPELIRGAHKRGLLVHVWGDPKNGSDDVNDPIIMKKLIKMGVDGLYVDNIVGLKQVMVERGMWPT